MKYVYYEKNINVYCIIMYTTILYYMKMGKKLKNKHSYNNN